MGLQRVGKSRSSLSKSSQLTRPFKLNFQDKEWESGRKSGGKNFLKKLKYKKVIFIANPVQWLTRGHEFLARAAFFAKLARFCYLAPCADIYLIIRFESMFTSLMLSYY